MQRVLVALVLFAACRVWAGQAPPADPPIHAAGIIGAPTAGGGFQNLDPGYQRASYAARLFSLVFGGSESKKRVAPLLPCRADVNALRALINLYVRE